MKAFVVPDRAKGVCSPPPLPLSPGLADRTVDLLKALADPTRLQMIGMLKRAQQPVCICDFTAAFDFSQPTSSHHMGKLRAAGLVEVSRKGIWSYYRLRPQLEPATRALLDVIG